MYFEKAEKRGEVVIRGDEILRLNKLIRKEDSDVCWAKYGLGERMEGFVHFLDWDIFCIVRADGYKEDRTLYYHIEDRQDPWNAPRRFKDIYGREPWNKLYVRDHIIRFLVWKIMEFYQVSPDVITRTKHPPREPTIPKQQQTVDLFKAALQAVCEAQNLEIKDYEVKKVKERDWVSIAATIGHGDNIFTVQYYHILIGEKGAIFHLSKSISLSDIRHEWKGKKAKEHLYYMKNYPKHA